MYGLSKDCLILIPFRLPQINCFTLTLKCFSSDSDNHPDVGIRPLLQFPHQPRAGPGLLTLQYFPLIPSSYWVLSGSIYSFPLVRYACPLPAGVLHALLCLKAYSWCIHGERCTPCPPTPLPFCSLLPHLLMCKRLQLCWVILLKLHRIHNKTNLFTVYDTLSRLSLIQCTIYRPQPLTFIITLFFCKTNKQTLKIWEMLLFL